jgi:hypothetical protein
MVTTGDIKAGVIWAGVVASCPDLLNNWRRPIPALVPLEFSDSLDQAMQGAGQTVEYYVYNGDNHNLLNNWGTVMRRTIEFFDQHVKGK